MSTDQFIQDALRYHHKGSLHRQLGVPRSEKIPKTLLAKVANAHAGDTIYNPTSVGKKRIKVTRLLERRVILARTLSKLHK
jgi:hypothetical protein